MNPRIAPVNENITGTHFTNIFINSPSNTLLCEGNTKILCWKKFDPPPIIASRPK